MKNILPTYRLDLQGEPCPYPAIRTLEVLPELKNGDILEIISDCPQSINNIPIDAKNHGYEVLEIEQIGATIRYFIKKP
ncbi:sulfurtransferase-like selenium metabolism protein YedF [Helicobacter ibis]|uniref:Putative sulfur carrier protein YedF n=1 Tax=Helicobacter ibis TaxID=2962633 RepID=A0ABT4VFZ4_9HELI|nr:sulfurtransferase-like selenium metabolism protein YedF [Helicobacter sp. WB40]MDA3967979.1 sulfurtransferase-like selenium metabolism protein YedF [Helicobacter sp. WB40]MDA3969647.1 sulfurtransferase-like selenium metabolism protein YedF [Helicobacter ibis]